LEREPRAVVTGAGLLALDALAGRLARARATTATQTLLGLRGSSVRGELVQRDRHDGSRAGAGDSGAEKELEQLRDRLVGWGEDSRREIARAVRPPSRPPRP